MGYAMKSNLRVLLSAVLLLPLLAFLSCSDPDSDDEITPPLASTTPGVADKVPDSYLENNSWKRLSDTQFETIWDAYNLDVQASKKANFYQKDKKMGETKVYWDCPITKKSGSDFVLSYGLGLSTEIFLTRRLPEYDAVYQSKENTNLIRFYKKDAEGVYEAVHNNGWLVEVSEEKSNKSYVEIIEYWTGD